MRRDTKNFQLLFSIHEINFRFPVSSLVMPLQDFTAASCSCQICWGFSLMSSLQVFKCMVIMYPAEVLC